MPGNAPAPGWETEGPNTTITKPDQKLQEHLSSELRSGSSAYLINVPPVEHICGDAEFAHCIPCTAEWLIELIERGA